MKFKDRFEGNPAVVIFVFLSVVATVATFCFDLYDRYKPVPVTEATTVALNAIATGLDMQTLPATTTETASTETTETQTTVTTEAPTTTEKTTTTTKETTTKKPAPQGIDIGDYLKKNSSNWIRFSVKGSKLASKLGCTKVSGDRYIYKSKKGTEINCGSGDDSFIWEVSWTDPSISLYGLKVGDPVSAIAPTLKKTIITARGLNKEGNKIVSGASDIYVIFGTKKDEITSISVSIP